MADKCQQPLQLQLYTACSHMTRDVHVTVDAVMTFNHTVRILRLKNVNYGVNRKKTLYTAV